MTQGEKEEYKETTNNNNNTPSSSPWLTLCFEGQAIAHTDRAQYPGATSLCTAIVNTVDGGASAVVPIAPDGTFSVCLPFPRGGQHERDTLKFHFFAAQDIFMGSNDIGFEHFLKHLNETAGKEKTKPVANGDIPPILACTHNFHKHTVSMWARGTQTPSEAAATLEAYTRDRPMPSALHTADAFWPAFRDELRQIQAALYREARVTPNNGGAMFVNVGTWHGMQNQATSTLHLQADMEPTAAQMDMLIDSGILTYFLVDTLHFRGITVDQALGLEGRELTRFAGTVSMTAQRSAHTAPYFQDMTMELDDSGSAQTRISEHFKRMFGEPFNRGVKPEAGALIHDDCDGLAADLHVVLLAFRRLWERFGDQGPSDGNDVQSLFPQHLHSDGGGMSPEILADFRRKVMAMGLKIGKALKEEKIRSFLVFMSMIGSHPTESIPSGPVFLPLGGHVLHSLQDWHEGEDKVFDILNEGTSLFAYENHDPFLNLRIQKNIATAAPTSDDANTDDFAPTTEEHFQAIRIPMSAVINELSTHLLSSAAEDNEQRMATHPAMEEGSDPMQRICMHVSELTRYNNYVAVFVQGNKLVGRIIEPELSPNAATDPTKSYSLQSSPGQQVTEDKAHEEVDRRVYAPSSTEKAIEFGLDAADIGNYKVKAYITPALAQSPTHIQNLQLIERHIRERASEIHPPLTTMARLQEYLRQAWSPIAPFLGLPALEGRKFMTCIVTRAYDSHDARDRALRSALEKASNFNRLHPNMGHMAAYVSTSAVVVCAYLYIDRMEAIAESVTHALHFAARDRLVIAEEGGGGAGGNFFLSRMSEPATLTDDA